ncbi:MAG: ABC transporter permease [Candidatus Woesearchaeota archaeon]
MHSKKDKLKQIVAPVLTFVIFVILWQLIDYLFNIRTIILPNPLEIFFVVVNNLPFLLDHTITTLLEAILGFLLGSFLGVMTAILFTYSKLLKKSLYPYAVAFKAIPVVALAPLLIMWFGSGMASKIVMASIICYFPVLIGTIKGLSAVTQDNLDLFKSLSASNWKSFWKLRLPSSFPYLFPSLKISITFAIVGTIIAEFTGAAKGIGYIIVNSSYYLETTMMFAAIVMISVAGVLFFYFIDYLEKKIVFWHKESL